MAETFVNVNEGSSKKIHHWDRSIGANTVLDEFVIIADQSQATYIIDGSGVSIATANDHVLQIMAGASLNVYLRRLRVWQSQTLATTAAVVQYSLFRLTTAGTGGTALTPDPVDTTDAAAGATGMNIPTVKGTESTRLLNFTLGTIQTVPAAGVNPLIVDLDFDKNPRLKPIRIAAGTSNGLALKNVGAAAGAQVFIVADITEANY